MKTTKSQQNQPTTSGDMTARPGTYALVLCCQKKDTVRIGCLGSLVLQPGFYVYVGSAFGSGGLAARLRHHRQIASRPHWHIDYLPAHCDLVEVWFTTSAGSHEHGWARTVARLSGAEVPVLGFGASDCKCPAHLYWFTHQPSAGTLRRLARSRWSGDKVGTTTDMTIWTKGYKARPFV